jgi:hypothetical protein
MRTIIPIMCALCIATPSRADTPPASSPAPATAPAAPGPAAADPFVPPPAPPPRHSRIPEIVASIVTGGLVVATAASYWKWNQVHDFRRSAQWDPDVTRDEYNRAMDDTVTWKKRTWSLIGVTFASAAVTAFMWMRHQDPSSFSVQPTGDGDGAAVSYGGRF